MGQRILSHFHQIWDYERGRVWLELLPEVASLPFNRAGLGLLKGEDGTFNIALVNPNSPAEAAGIRAGERVTRLNGREAPELSRGEAMALFVQPVGSVVTVKVCGAEGTCRDIRLILREVLPLAASPVPQ